MANVIHLRCRHCGEPLDNRDEAYCPPCNLYLAYRAMPFLLGMLLIGRTGIVPADRCPQDPQAIGSDKDTFDDDGNALDVTAINWE
jgi:hypothetical protein